MEHFLFDLDGTLLPMDQEVFVNFICLCWQQGLRPGSAAGEADRSGMERRRKHGDE